MKPSAPIFLLLAASLAAAAAAKHSPSSLCPTYEGRVLCGYQAWFRAPDDGANEGWGHYASRGKLLPGICFLGEGR